MASIQIPIITQPAAVQCAADIINYRIQRLTDAALPVVNSYVYWHDVYIVITATTYIHTRPRCAHQLPLYQTDQHTVGTLTVVMGGTEAANSSRLGSLPVRV